MAVDLWGWIEPVFNVLEKVGVRGSRRRRLRKALEGPDWHEGRTLEALRRVAGEADTSEGRERTRGLLRGVKSGGMKARQLKRTDPKAEEMWGLRSD